MNKKALRDEINRHFLNMNDSTLENLSRRTTEIFVKSKIWNSSDIILAFLSFGKELKTDSIINQAIIEGKRIAVPRIYGKEMKFHYIESLNDNFEINKWDIKEPLRETPVWKDKDGKTLMVTPGLAFSPKGGRLGRGGGFYDRFLSTYGKNIFTAAFCTEGQIRDNVPVEEHDRIMDAVCSDSHFYQL